MHFAAAVAVLLLPTNVRATESVTPTGQYYAFQPTSSSDTILFRSESETYDATTKKVFISGRQGDGIRVLSKAADGTLTLDATVQTGSLFEVSDMATCGGYLYWTWMLSATATPEGRAGQLCALPIADIATATAKCWATGNQPDMVKVSKNCNIVLTANEGEPQNIPQIDAGQACMSSSSHTCSFTNYKDPPGTVGIFRFTDVSSFAALSPTETRVDFSLLDLDRAKYLKAGVRWVTQPLFLMGAAEATMANDVQPEYIALSSDESEAYVVLQEQNAMATISIAQNAVTDVKGLGYQDMGAIDASDRDSGMINVVSYAVKGMRQPDQITLFQHDCEDYIITANEGDAVVAGLPAGSEEDYEEYRLKKFLTFDTSVAPTWLITLSPLSPTLQTQIGDNSILGRLKCTMVPPNLGGKLDLPLQITDLYCYGTRSFSIFKAKDMSLVWDSGPLDQEMANRVTAGTLPAEVFNGEFDEGDLTASCAAEKDQRSDAKGGEPESVVVGLIDGRRYAFAFLERNNILNIFDVTDPKAPVLKNMQLLAPNYSPISTGVTQSLYQLYQEQKVGVIDPESVTLVPDEKLLIVAGAKSSTVYTYSIGGTTPGPLSGGGCGGDDDFPAWGIAIAVVIPVVFVIGVAVVVVVFTQSPAAATPHLGEEQGANVEKGVKPTEPLAEEAPEAKPGADA